jgi:hypothetical protein
MGLVGFWAGILMADDIDGDGVIEWRFLEAL